MSYPQFQAASVSRIAICCHSARSVKALRQEKETVCLTREGLTDIVVALSTDYKGSAAKCDAEFNWIIKAIEYPDGYKPEDEGKIRELIKEAFIVNSYSELFNHERVKNVSVRFEC